MDILNEYLTYLNENKDEILSERTYEVGVMKDAAGKAVPKTVNTFGKFATHNIKTGLRGSFKWTLFVTLGLGTAWKLANFAFNKAYRKCGGMTTSGNGKKICMTKEKLIALQQKLNIVQKVLPACNKSNNPEICKQETQIQIDKVKNKISFNQNKLKELTALAQEQTNLTEQGIALAAAGMAMSIGAGIVMDTVLQKSWRMALAIFSQASRKCGVFKKGPAREACMCKYKLLSLTKQLNVLSSVLSSCSKQHNPDACSAKVRKKIEKTQTLIQLQKDNINSYTKEAETLKREKEMKRAQKLAAKNM